MLVFLPHCMLSVGLRNTMLAPCRLRDATLPRGRAWRTACENAPRAVDTPISAVGRSACTAASSSVCNGTSCANGRLCACRSRRDLHCRGHSTAQSLACPRDLRQDNTSTDARRAAQSQWKAHHQAAAVNEEAAPPALHQHRPPLTGHRLGLCAGYKKHFVKLLAPTLGT